MNHLIFNRESAVLYVIVLHLQPYNFRLIFHSMVSACHVFIAQFKIRISVNNVYVRKAYFLQQLPEVRKFRNEFSKNTMVQMLYSHFLCTLTTFDDAIIPHTQCN